MNVDQSEVDTEGIHIMKRNLGKLETQFFAWVQLRK